MKDAKPWTLLRKGKIEQGLRPLAQVYAKEPTPSHTMELGVAYLWAERYEAAWDHFSMTNEMYSKSTSDFYGMAGVAKWCLGEYGEAVANWVSGLDAEFADTNGLGVSLPLLLYFASVVRPSTFAPRSAERILKEKSRDSRIAEWPGPIASWLLNQISECELSNLSEGDDECDTLDRHWLTEFYRSVVHYGENKHFDFKESMRKLADISRPEWSDQSFFLARMWSAEFFLARHSAK